MLKAQACSRHAFRGRVLSRSFSVDGFQDVFFPMEYEFVRLAFRSNLLCTPRAANRADGPQPD